MKKEHIDELIAKYFSGEASPEEAMMLDDWKMLSAENTQYVAECSHVFNTGRTTTVDTKRMYRNVLAEIGVAGEKPAARSLTLNYSRYIRIAAAVLIFAMTGVTLFIFNNKAAPAQVFVSAGTMQQQKLADGSDVFLNKNTRLSVAEGFNKKERRLKLEGEAFFNVKHDDGKPFVIDAGGVEIRDIGTAFNIKARPGSDSVLVVVEEGIVEMTAGQTTVRLIKDQSALFIRSKNLLLPLAEMQANASAYRTKTFHFRNNTLAEVVGLLNEVYGNSIILENPVLADCRITVDFTNEPIETIVSVIAETLELTYQRRGNGYVIRGTQCIQ